MFIMVLFLMLFISCRSVEPKIIYKTAFIVPDLDFPEFPVLGECEELDEGVLVKDKNFFIDLLIYKIKIKDVEELYKEKKKLYEGVKDE